jgi:hypothetical protein
LLAGDPQHGNFSMGLANIELKRGTAPAAASSSTLLHGGSAGKASKSEEVDLEESIFAFSKAPEEQIGRAAKGGPTGARIRLEPPQNGNSGRIVISLGEKQASFDVAENLAREVGIEGTELKLKIANYWPDFQIQDGKPSSLSDQPNNPAVLVTIRGKGIPGAETRPNPHGGTEMPATGGPPTMPASGEQAPNSHGGTEMPATGGPPTMPAYGEQASNHLALFIADDGAITYEHTSRKTGK